VKKETIYNGKIVKLAKEECILPDGRSYMQEIIHHPGGACAVPIFENGDVVLLKQYRYAAGGFIWEIPAGKLDIEGEDPKNCAARELIEEAGLKSGKLEKIISINTTPGFCDEILHIYKATSLSETSQNTEEHEILEVHKLTKSEVCAMIKKREITDAKTLIGLMLCGYLPD